MVNEELPAPAGQDRTIIVVEDQEEIRALETFLLEMEGYRVVGVADGDSAVPTIQREQPALVLLDLVLPGKDGNRILQELQADGRTSHIPVIVVSAYSERLQPTAQVRRVVRKPFEVDDLLEAVRQEALPRAS